MVNMNKHRDPAVYALHAGDGIYRYVGITAMNSKNRLWEHIYRARIGHQSPVYQWMREVGIENVIVTDLFKEANPETRVELEASTIARLISEGVPLVNQISRDGKVNSMSAESRALIGAQNRGRPTWIKGRKGQDAGWTDERRAQASAYMKARRADGGR